jgi:hypothetical protein
MANILTASIYGYQGNPDYTSSMGIEIGFPTNQILIKPTSPAIQFQGVDCNSTIEIVTAQPPFPIYYAKESASTLITNANT